jgi:hypothetical protein
LDATGGTGLGGWGDTGLGGWTLAKDAADFDVIGVLLFCGGAMGSINPASIK